LTQTNGIGDKMSERIQLAIAEIRDGLRG